MTHSMSWIEFLSSIQHIITLCKELYVHKNTIPQYLKDIYIHSKRFSVDHLGSLEDISSFPSFYNKSDSDIEIWIYSEGDIVKIKVYSSDLVDPMTLQKENIQVNQTYRRIEVDAQLLKHITYNWITQTVAKELCRRQIVAIKEELMAEVWKPSRVSAWIEAGFQMD